MYTYIVFFGHPSPLDKMQVYCSVTPALNLPIPICTPWWREMLWELSVLPKNTTEWQQQSFRVQWADRLASTRTPLTDTLKKCTLILLCSHSGGVTKSSQNGGGTDADYELECCQIVLSSISPWWEWLFYKSLTSLHLKSSVWFKWVELKELSIVWVISTFVLFLRGK